MHRIHFEAMDWESPMPHVRQKVYEEGGRRLRLVEFARDFVEPDWCIRGHVGYVLSGQMEIRFPDGTTSFNPGDGVFIAPGTKHLATVLTDAVTLIFVEDA